MSDPVKLSAERQAAIEKWTGACNPMTGEQQICASYDNNDANFTSEDVNNVLDGYYRAEGLDAKRFEKLLSQVHPSATPGCLCWKSLGGAENRKLADAIAETCENKVLKGSPDAKIKCDTLESAVDRLAEKPWYIENGLAVGGFLLLALLFSGAPSDLYQVVKEKVKEFFPPKDPPSGSNGTGDKYTQNNYTQNNYYGQQSPSNNSKPVRSLPHADNNKSMVTPEQVALVGAAALIGVAAVLAAPFVAAAVTAAAPFVAVGAGAGCLIMMSPNMMDPTLMDPNMRSSDGIPDA